MKARVFLVILIAGITVLAFSCGPGRDPKTADLAPNAHMVTAEEVIQTTMYTYVRVSSDGRDYWVAINKTDIKEGETYYWSVGSEMNDFTSKELKRTFPSIFFIQDFTDQPITPTRRPPASGMTAEGQPQVQQPTQEFKSITVQKAKGGVTIAELFTSGGTYAGKKVKIRGEVVKFSAGIMNRNWVHLQDGTRDGDKFDLTVTTQETVKPGDMVTFEGTVAVKKDFGAGYFYEVIVEDARLIEN
jgi:hypothetical protein